MAKKKRTSGDWQTNKSSFPKGPKGFQKKGTTGVRKGVR